MQTVNQELVSQGEFVLCVFFFCFFCILNISKDHMFITCDGCRSGRIPGHRQPKIRAECRMCSVIHFILLMT